MYANILVDILAFSMLMGVNFNGVIHGHSQQFNMVAWWNQLFIDAKT